MFDINGWAILPFYFMSKKTWKARLGLGLEGKVGCAHFIKDKVECPDLVYVLITYEIKFGSFPHCIFSLFPSLTTARTWNFPALTRLRFFSLLSYRSGRFRHMR
uniref:Uncharacterized protein n=1 Tax=Populus trichocarpa TaxID=3694 RepID=A0A2K1ZAL9_POPTR